MLAVCCGEPSAPDLVAWPDPRPESVLIRNVHVLDVMSGSRGEPVDVRIEGDRITAIGPGASVAVAGSPAPSVIEGAGATLVPGLVDMHGHVDARTRPVWQLTASATPEANLEAYVYAGVTTVFDPGDGSGEAFERRARVEAGELIGPRIVTVGPILTAPSSHPLAMVEELLPRWLAWLVARGLAIPLPDDDAVREHVDRLAHDGADAIKIVIDRIPLDAPRMSRERARAVVERASRHGLRTVAHIGTTEDALDAGHAGVALWVHGVYKERIPEARIAELAGFGIPMVATTEVFDAYGRLRSGPPMRTKLERETVLPEVLDSFHPIPEDFDPGPLESWVALMEETREIRRQNVARLHAAGVTILAGSDVQSGVFPGAALHRELHHLVAAGLSPIEAIRAATILPARFLRERDDPDFGVIGVHNRADLILVEGDPTRDIAALAELRAVILGGVPVVRTPVGADSGP